MASADFCTFSGAFRHRLPSADGVPHRPPRVRVWTFRSCTCPIYWS